MNQVILNSFEHARLAIAVTKDKDHPGPDIPRNFDVCALEIWTSRGLPPPAGSITMTVHGNGVASLDAVELTPEGKPAADKTVLTVDQRRLRDFQMGLQAQMMNLLGSISDDQALTVMVASAEVIAKIMALLLDDPLPIIEDFHKRMQAMVTRCAMLTEEGRQFELVAMTRQAVLFMTDGRTGAPLADEKPEIQLPPERLVVSKIKH